MHAAIPRFLFAFLGGTENTFLFLNCDRGLAFVVYIYFADVMTLLQSTKEARIE